MSASITKLGLITAHTEIVDDSDTIAGMDNSFFSVSIKRVNVQSSDIRKENKADSDAIANSIPEVSNVVNTDSASIDKPQTNNESVSSASSIADARKPMDKHANNSKEQSTEGSDMDEVDDDDELDNLTKEYPVGSVVATVNVMVNAVYTSVVDENQSGKKENVLFHSVSFRGCISEHAETDWKIIDLH